MTRSFGAREPGLPKHELLKLIRIQRQSVQTYDAQQETVKHLAEIRRRQMVQDYETEYDNLRAATVHTAAGTDDRTLVNLIKQQFRMPKTTRESEGYGSDVRRQRSERAAYVSTRISDRLCAFSTRACARSIFPSRWMSN